MLYDWAAEHANNVRCIAGIYPVSNLESYPGLGSKRLQTAYGLNEAELREHLRQNNPIDRLAPLARARVPIFHIHGDADKVVSLPQNTLELVGSVTKPWVARPRSRSSTAREMKESRRSSSQNG